MLKEIKKIIAKPAPWAYFILVVALLIIVSNQAGTVKDLEADLSNANDEISEAGTQIDVLSDEIAIRDDAITGLESDVGLLLIIVTSLRCSAIRWISTKDSTIS